MQVGSRRSPVDSLSRQAESPVDSRQSRVPNEMLAVAYSLKEKNLPA